MYQMISCFGPKELTSWFYEVMKQLRISGIQLVERKMLNERCHERACFDMCLGQEQEAGISRAANAQQTDAFVSVTWKLKFFCFSKLEILTLLIICCWSDLARKPLKHFFPGQGSSGIFLICCYQCMNLPYIEKGYKQGWITNIVAPDQTANGGYSCHMLWLNYVKFYLKVWDMVCMWCSAGKYEININFD